MTLSEVKNRLAEMNEVGFVLPDGSMVAAHFHITEIGRIEKHFIDCGGTLRTEKRVGFQLWQAEDFDHRLGAEKLMKIIALSEKKLQLEDDEVEVEYQGETIGKYTLDHNGQHFTLVNTHTDCLAKDQCGIPAGKAKLVMSSLQDATSCAPGSGCC